MEPRPVAQLAALEGRMVELDNKLTKLIDLVAALSQRMESLERKSEEVEAFDSIQQVRRPRRGA